MTTWIGLALAVAAGLASGVQGPANGALARAWDFWRAVALNGFVVCVVTAIGLVLTRRDAPPAARAPWWCMIGGFCGALVICSAAYAMPRIGAATFTVGLVLGMLVASLLVDHYGWFGQAVRAASPLKLVGVTLVLAGVALVRLVDR
ncbi:MAG TPA: DMT family transporter [Planctomycetota bacterium]|nr:DMT family transporter [Planctomycetota bacterium]